MSGRVGAAPTSVRPLAATRTDATVYCMGYRVQGVEYRVLGIGQPAATRTDATHARPPARAPASICAHREQLIIDGGFHGIGLFEDLSHKDA